jgi:hypothetical protein
VDRLKTDVGMLPQFVPLEAREADTPGKARNGLGHIAGFELSRGETRPKGGHLPGSLRNGGIVLEQTKWSTFSTKERSPLCRAPKNALGSFLNGGAPAFTRGSLLASDWSTGSRKTQSSNRSPSRSTQAARPRASRWSGRLDQKPKLCR